MTFAGVWNKFMDLLEFKIIDFDTFTFSVYQIIIIVAVYFLARFVLWTT